MLYGFVCAGTGSSSATSPVGVRAPAPAAVLAVASQTVGAGVLAGLEYGQEDGDAVDNGRVVTATTQPSNGSFFADITLRIVNVLQFERETD